MIFHIYFAQRGRELPSRLTVQNSLFILFLKNKAVNQSKQRGRGNEEEEEEGKGRENGEGGWSKKMGSGRKQVTMKREV